MPATVDAGAQRYQAQTRRKRWVLAALVTIMLISFAWNMTRSATPSRSHGAEPETDEAPVQEESLDMRVVLPYDPGHDLFLGRALFESPQPETVAPAPTQPAAPLAIDPVALREEASRLLDLQALIKGRYNTAIINGQRVVDGTTIEGFRVIDIKDTGVTLERDGVHIELELER
ncbi:MAG: hypothetical protein ACIAXF_16095 [Phycisphaerales bacterium JB063]